MAGQMQPNAVAAGFVAGGPSNVWSRVFGSRYEALPTEERISPHLPTEAVRPPLCSV